jgi:hypothetical protein
MPDQSGSTRRFFLVKQMHPHAGHIHATATATLIVLHWRRITIHPIHETAIKIEPLKRSETGLWPVGFTAL